MKIGHLFRAHARPRGVVGFQLLRVVVVMVLAATGSYALSLSVDDESSLQESVVAVKQQDDSASAPHSVDEPHQTASLQVTNVEPAAPDLASGSAMAPAASDELAHEGAHASMPDDTSRDDAASTFASPSSETQQPEPEQASSGESSSSTSSEMTGAVSVASIASDPAQGGNLVDLNTASFEQLNALRDVGPIGRAIIKGRPYASVEDLVKRKVLRRPVFEKIKDQVTVR